MTTPSKAELRQTILLRLQKFPLGKFVSDGEIATKNHIIPWLCEQGIDRTWCVGLFKSFKTEISVATLDSWLAKLKVKRCLPLVGEQHQAFWVDADHGEPCQQNSLTPPALSVLFVPGLAFDMQGNRLGRGGGFYDRLLAQLTTRVPSPFVVGLALDEQIVPQVPTEPNDVAVDFLCSPSSGLFRTTKE
jgi:5,10-methenyltetrahydrofolate synthetase